MQAKLTVGTMHRSDALPQCNTENPTVLEVDHDRVEIAPRLAPGDRISFIIVIGFPGCLVAVADRRARAPVTESR
jgi:hypothetical protein